MLNMMALRLSCLLSILSVFQGAAQEWEFVRKHDLGQTIIAADVGVLGKTYFGTERGIVYSFHPDGTADTDYSSAIFQPITSIDASNTLRVFVFYASTGQFEYLERFSAQARMYQLSDFGVEEGSVACIGVNQSIWVLSGEEFIQINTVNPSIVRTQAVPEKTKDITQIRVLRNQLTISDKEKGIAHFLSASTTSRLEGLGARNFHYEGNSVITLLDGHVVHWNLMSGRDERFDPPRVDFEMVLKSGEYYHFTRGSEVLIYKKSQP